MPGEAHVSHPRVVAVPATVEVLLFHRHPQPVPEQALPRGQTTRWVTSVQIVSLTLLSNILNRNMFYQIVQFALKVIKWHRVW